VSVFIPRAYTASSAGGRWLNQVGLQPMASLFPPPITASNKEKCTVLQEGGASNLQYSAS